MPLRQNSADVAGTNADTNPEKITEAWNEYFGSRPGARNFDAIFSMIVTTIVETLHRIFGVREKGLEIMLGEVYDEIIEPQIRPSSPGSAIDNASNEMKGTFV